MKILRGIFFAILTFSVLAIAIHQNPSTSVRFVNVTGVGTTNVVPDAVRLSATVTTTSSSSASALAATSKSAATFRQVLTGAGVVAKYIQTQTLTVTPNYTYSQNGTSKISGYQASQQFNVVIRNTIELPVRENSCAWQNMLQRDVPKFMGQMKRLPRRNI